ncbi:hypothetical protein BZG35_15775 [Brevundimonas sp. LM2]|uniref:hypothetical protein n=1 Tax=Brevundimonas sp. LM2 TaxID=1938605 RepID=UPI000983A8AB|nr:hypothetical protein [Brevundimonas sp. LM2]AQR62951.1 hypothetical protein BZG35_15775 [Brevundimonas sp. LM2]
MSDPAQPALAPGHASEGKPAALIAWGLFILSIPSAALLAPVGLIVAYAGRGSATGIPRQHLDAAIRLFWSVFWWTIATGILLVVSVLLSWLLLPIVFIFLLWGVLILLGVWFTIKSVLALLNLLQDKPA